MKAEIEEFREWLEDARADDFGHEADTPEREAFNLMWDACAILFRQGHGASGILKTLTNVIYELEIDDEDEEDPGDWQLEVD